MFFNFQSWIYPIKKIRMPTQEHPDRSLFTLTFNLNYLPIYLSEYTHTGKTIKGYLQLTVGKSIYKAANDLYDQYVPVRKQSIIDFLEQQKTMYLNALVSDKEEFDRKDALLRSINAQVQSFKDSIR